MQSLRVVPFIWDHKQQQVRAVLMYVLQVSKPTCCCTTCPPRWPGTLLTYHMAAPAKQLPAKQLVDLPQPSANLRGPTREARLYAADSAQERPPPIQAGGGRRLWRAPLAYGPLSATPPNGSACTRPPHSLAVHIKVVRWFAPAKPNRICPTTPPISGSGGGACGGARPAQSFDHRCRTKPLQTLHWLM